MFKMSNSAYISEDEFDVGEIFALLWSHKALIVCALILSISLGIYYVTVSEKKYIATSVFKIEDNNNSNFNLSSEFSAIAAIAGIDSLKSTNTDSLLERITAREFILDMNAKTLLENDPFFNDYDPSHKDPF